MMQTQPLINKQVLNPLTLSVPEVKKRPNSFSIELNAMHSKNRQQQEDFVKTGFEKAYQAKVNITMPYLLTLSQGQFKAALGFRGGHLPLFIESYLNKRIEQQSYFKQLKVARKDVVEIGHLFSNSKLLTLPLFTLTALSLTQLGYKHLVFSGTDKVIQLFERSGIKFTLLAIAKEEQLPPSNDDWGNYYSTNPKVVTFPLEQAISAVKKLPIFESLFYQFMAGTHDICQQFLFQQTRVNMQKS